MPLPQQRTADDCVCGGTGLLTTLTEDGGNTGPYICPRCYVPAAERDNLILAANSARVLIERHRATRGGSSLLTTALQELDDVLPTYASGGE